jgi:diguanylate cyclase (GGDEF)-like protein
MHIKRTLSRTIYALGLMRTSDELAREQFLALSRQVSIMYSVIIFNSFFLAFSVWSDVGTVNAFAFPVLITPLMGIRYWIWHKRAKVIESFPIDVVRKALRGNVVTAFLIAFLIGCWTVNMMWSMTPQYFAYVPLFTVLSMITCAYCLASLPAATYAVVITGTTYIASAMYMTGDVMMMVMSGNVMIITGFVIYMVANQFGQFRKLVESRSQIMAQRAHANRLAHNDQLTNMPNRRAFLAALHNHKNNSAEGPVAVVMMDLNGFKPINDTYGHCVGDELLINAGECLSRVVGNQGIVARLGGDEFAVFFSNPPGSEWIKDRVLQMVHEIDKPIIIDTHEIRMSAAFGICHVLRMPEEPIELVQRADIALYDAKNSKLSAFSFFEGSMEERVQRRTRIEQALSDCVQMAGIDLHFQPIFALNNGTHIGFEALARWDHPELGTIPPAEFISAAERCGLATKLTIHLFHEALKTASLWPQHIGLSFNLSGSGLGTSNLDAILPEILTQMHFCPSRLSVEVTETALLSNPQVAQEMLERLRRIGVRIVLDDFGAGYASIGYLQKMQFDGIKLDGSLIRNIVDDEKSRNLLIGVLHLCKSINAEVTAEMVENEEQLALLKPLPIEFIQGYLLGGPVPAESTLEQGAVKAALRPNVVRYV